MKKIIIVFTVVITIIVSCKKDYKCDCTETTSDGRTYTGFEGYKDVTKNKAQTMCDDFEKRYGYFGSGVTSTKTCTLKKM